MSGLSLKASDGKLPTKSLCLLSCREMGERNSCRNSISFLAKMKARTEALGGENACSGDRNLFGL